MKSYLLTTLFSFTFLTTSAQTFEKPNFIFIIADDLNDYISPLGGHPQVQTPHLQTLADSGYVFSNSFCNSPVCAPSRTSLLSGKDLQYTQVYRNEAYLSDFRDNFTAAKSNEEVITIPEHLKKNGYYTYGINKIFHDAFRKDFDDSILNPCEKELSWSRVRVFNNSDAFESTLDSFDEGINKYNWGRVDSNLESQLKDYRAADTAIAFLTQVQNGEVDLCDGNFFLSIGFSLPHLDLYVPEPYYSDFYLKDIYDVPYNIPYNDPYNAFPYNGIILPPQPEIRFADYEALGPLGKAIAVGQGDIETSFGSYSSGLIDLPEINPFLSDEERISILEDSKRANAIMAYIAAVEFVDVQIGRIIDQLQSMPEYAENTIIIFVGDNGFSFGEKYHWQKRSFWETDIRVPIIIFDPSKPGNFVCNQTSSLLDLFPTICDLAGIPHPTFSDGSKYLDGKSLSPILNSPAIKSSAPVLVSWEAEPGKECSCYPQYAVRSDKFAYLRYQSDGGNPVHDCITGESFMEEELYEVGVLRETDPNEWNNLIANSDYEPVISYLQQFLPDSIFYLQSTHIATITNKDPICILKYNSVLKLKATLHNPNGSLILPTETSNYVFQWTNNLTELEYTGVNFILPMSSIPSLTFMANNRIMIYLHVYDLDGNLVAFATNYYSLNPSTKPSISFDISISESTISIIDYVLTGAYVSTSWDFGDGTVLNDLIPADHVYETGGSYNVKNIITYGNGCTISKNKIITIPAIKIFNPSPIIIHPNPSNSYFQLSSHEQIQIGSELSVINIEGIKMKIFKVLEENYYDISELNSGFYFISFQTENNIPKILSLVIQH